MSARGHLIALAFWLVIGAFPVLRLLTGDGRPGVTTFALGVAVVGNLVVLLASYRTTLRHSERPSSPTATREGRPET